MIGQTLSHFQITAKLGEGGMGEVYRAVDTKLGREVAIKVLPEELAGDPVRLERLEREARALAALDHPNIVTLYSVEEAEGIHFLTMALVEGRTVRELIPRRGLPLEELLDLAIPLVDAVRAAHERGIVHRDLKPSNLMVDTEGRLRVLDFGLAKLTGMTNPEEASQAPTEAMTQEGTILGSYPYMSPEQVEGKPADERADIFSLGVVLHEMATGNRPFDGETPASLMAAILREDPPAIDETRPDLPHHLGRIIRHCLEKDPERRYSRAKDLLYELKTLERETISKEHMASISSPSRSVAGRRLSRYVAVILVAAAASFGVYSFIKARTAPEGPIPRAIRSLAVLPFTNLMNDPEQEYFVDGMTEALIADLARLGELRVISRTSAMSYKGTDKTSPEIARELDVDALLEGSVLRVGDEVRITAQLIDGETDAHLWTETYDRKLTHILALHSEVARAVAGEIELQLTPRELELLGDSTPIDPEAYESYLKGRYHSFRFTPEDLQEGQRELERALTLEPDFAPAHAAIATLHMALMQTGAIPSTEAAPPILRAARRALELDETNAEAQLAMVFLHLIYELDFPAARAANERVLTLYPNNAYGHWGLGLYHVVMGDLEKALEEMRTARRLEPVEALWSFGVGYCLWLLGRDQEALGPLRYAIELNPGLPWTHSVLADVLWRQGFEVEAVQEAATAYRLLGLPETAEAFSKGYASGGREEGFRSAARSLEGVAADRFISHSQIAMAWALGNMPDHAFGWLERAVEARDAYLYNLRREPGLASLHGDPRFDQLTRSLGLPD